MAGKRSVLDYYLNFDYLRVMLVLYRDNPDLTLEFLEKETGIPKDKLARMITELIERELVNTKQVDDRQVYSLSESARFGFERIGLKL
jgi:DNA-binding MarR family transcriptional regulator